MKAVDDVSFDIKRGETLGVVGESGCGKSTTGRAILQLHKPTAGHVFFEDIDLTTLNQAQLRALRPENADDFSGLGGFPQPAPFGRQNNW